MAYLSVDRNGEENICNEKPIRHGIKQINGETFAVYETEDGRIEGCCFIQGSGMTYKKMKKSDLSYWTSEDSEITKLPKGSIEKLIGHAMTFEDEPYEL